MADKKAPNVSINKVAMSRALGAAFLSHQVEQLEKSVSSNGPASGNWRDRKNPNIYGNVTSGGPKKGPNSPGIKVAQRKKVSETPTKERQRDKDFDRSTPGIIRRSQEGPKKDKDADVVVVDASVLIHALYQVKKWCKDGREEIVIVPLEALNTLDLLKKGTSSLAQKARSASRILEAQVGTNPRIRVQRDDAFVLWDKVTFEDSDPESNTPAASPNSCPEWVRRIICCARWETEHPEEEIKPVERRSLDEGDAANKTSANSNGKSNPRTNGADAEKKLMSVVLAVLSSPPNLSPQSASLKLADMSISTETSLNPVPLPAPSVPHGGRHEARSTGSLVTSWAARAAIRLFEVDPALPGRGEDEDRPKRSHPPGTRGRRPSMGEHGPKSGLVERPPAVMAMMEMISQPSKVVRVLARGEKLDPDP